MKTIAKILVIVLVAVLVGGATWLIGNQAGASGAFPERGARGDFDGDGDRPEGFPDGSGFPERGGREGRGERDGDGFNLFGIAGFAKTLIPITLIIALVVLVQNVVGRIRRGRDKTAPPPDPLTPAGA